MEWHEPALEESGEELSRAISFEDSEEGKVSWRPPPPQTHTHTHTHIYTRTLRRWSKRRWELGDGRRMLEAGREGRWAGMSGSQADAPSLKKADRGGLQRVATCLPPTLLGWLRQNQDAAGLLTSFFLQSSL